MVSFSFLFLSLKFYLLFNFILSYWIYLGSHVMVCFNWFLVEFSWCRRKIMVLDRCLIWQNTLWFHWFRIIATLGIEFEMKLVFRDWIKKKRWVVGTCNTHVYIGEGLSCFGYTYDSHECLLVTFLGIIQFKVVHKHVGGLVWLWWSGLSFFLLLSFFSLLSLIFTSNTLLNSKVVRHLFFFYIKHGPQSFDLVFFFNFILQH
jgi:hypothetical protein